MLGQHRALQFERRALRIEPERHPALPVDETRFHDLYVRGVARAADHELVAVLLVELAERLVLQYRLRRYQQLAMFAHPPRQLGLADGHLFHATEALAMRIAHGS